jgi:hypothetical protein
MLKKLAVLSLLIFTFSIAAKAQQDPLVGTWNLNLAKSKFNGIPAPKSQIYKYEANGPDGVKFTNDSVNADGTNVHAEYSVKFDGKEVPINGDPLRDMTTNKRVDANTTSGVSTLKGKPASSFRRVVSRDGKTLTITAKGTQGGKAYNQVTVYDKQ